MENKPMKNMKAVSAVLLLSSSVAGVEVMAADEKYPAYNFEPSVIYSNAELIEKTHGALAVALGPSTASIAAVVHEADPKYPAAYFNPTVLFPAR